MGRARFRSFLAVHSMQVVGYEYVVSLRTGLRGWNEYEQPLVARCVHWVA